MLALRIYNKLEYVTIWRDQFDGKVNNLDYLFLSMVKMIFIFVFLNSICYSQSSDFYNAIVANQHNVNLTVVLKARFHYERGKEHSFSLLLIFD